MTSPNRPRSFQEIILRLQSYWAAQGCAMLQPYDMEVGAGTFHPATTLRALGPEGHGPRPMSSPRAARPTGAMARTRTGCSITTSIRSSSNPRPRTCRSCIWAACARSASTPRSTTSASSRTTGNPRPSAPGAWAGRSGATGWRCSQFTYFQQVGGHDCRPVSGELTYGLERLAMYVLGVEHVMDMPFNDPRRADSADLWRHLPPDRGGILAAGTSTRPTPTCCCGTSRMPRPNAPASWRPPSRTAPAAASSWRIRPMTSASRPATSSTFWTRAA